MSKSVVISVSPVVLTKEPHCEQLELQMCQLDLRRPIPGTAAIGTPPDSTSQLGTGVQRPRKPHPLRAAHERGQGGTHLGTTTIATAANVN